MLLFAFVLCNIFEKKNFLSTYNKVKTVSAVVTESDWQLAQFFSLLLAFLFMAGLSFYGLSM